ncbi:Peptidase family M48 [Marinobacterium sp. xm-d-579]|uniref:M48 family metalloprotease n=1 Tax=Marinobacterium sp. xm-d-579 TaxID=2497734 RepID=UPI001568BF6A|nr:M48 family metalloprotease [Marinobacterium sp. xm-d-579]NRP35800.1 Peptidase family M48 [Marinobacterium sp. xm-d-579]
MQLITRVTATVCTALVLTGCQTENIKMPDFAANLHGFNVDRSEELDKPMVEKVAENYKPMSEPDFDKGLLELRKANRSHSDIPELEAYANEIKDKLLAVWPGKKPSVRVVIVSDGNYNAVTFVEQHVVALSVGTFRKAMDSEDQFAALIAHELSHILADHKNKDHLSGLVSKVSTLGELYLGAQQNAGADIAGDYAKTQLAGWAAESLLFPAWNRGQENEADALGVDLLVAAGYEPYGMVSVINSLEKTAGEKKAFVEKQWIAAKKNASGETVNISADPMALIANIGGQLKDQYGQEYDSYADRKSKVNNYIDAFHEEALDREATITRYKKRLSKTNVNVPLNRYLAVMDAEVSLAEGKVNTAASKALAGLQGPQANDPYIRYMMYQIRRQQGEMDKAAINLRKAFESDRATLSIYTDWADSLINAKKYEAANTVLKAADLTFEKPNSILPALIKVNKALKQDVNEYSIRCMATLDKTLMQNCSAASS